MSSPEDGFVFSCAFEDTENTAWLMEQDWIVDYDQYKNMPPVELRSICEKLAGEVNALTRDFNNKDTAYRDRHYDECKEKLNKMTHRLDSIEAIAEHLEGKLTFVFPEQITSHSPILKSAKKPGFFAKLFGWGTQ